jgi:hypothetical protein
MSIGLTLSQFEDVATIHAVQINGEIVRQRNNKMYSVDIPEEYMEKEIMAVEPYVEVGPYESEEDKSVSIRARLKIILWS